MVVLSHRKQVGPMGSEESWLDRVQGPGNA